MQALQLVAHGVPGQFRFGEIADPQPGTDEVVVAVEACGLNRLDLWTEEGGLPIPIDLPRVPGCEIAGVVLTTGAAVTGWRPGDRVAVQSNLFCGVCEWCERGEESMCLRGTLLGVQRDGGFAQRVCVPASALVARPAGVDARTSAALTLAGSTAMHMLTRRAAVRPGDWVLVVGASSGVGSAAIQIAAGLGARVLTLASTAEKRELGLRLGAMAAFDGRSDTWPAEVRAATGKRGVDWVVEHVGGRLLVQAFQALARGGTVVTCGATAGREVTLNLWPLFVKQQRLVGSYGRDRVDIAATLEWVAGGRLRAVVDEVVPLRDAPGAFAKLRSGAVFGKLVIEP